MNRWQKDRSHRNNLPSCWKSDRIMHCGLSAPTTWREPLLSAPALRNLMLTVHTFARLPRELTSKVFPISFLISRGRSFHSRLKQQLSLSNEVCQVLSIGQLKVSNNCMVNSLKIVEAIRPFPSSLVPLFQNESKCEPFI